MSKAEPAYLGLVANPLVDQLRDTIFAMSKISANVRSLQSKLERALQGRAAAVVAIGGVIALPLPDGATGARYQGDDALVVANHAIVGVPLDATPGPRAVTVSTAGGERVLTFTVRDKEYPERHLTVPNRRHVDPNPRDLERFRRERALQDAGYALRTAVRPGLLPFVLPAEGRRSSPFGARSFYNGKPRSPHSGLDIAAATGTPVRAPAPGTAVVIGDFFFNGKTVLLDHGGGLVTMYCHLSRVDVAEGEDVPRGQVIGAVGKTGRATGAHLHWTVRVRGVPVDPAQFMTVVNALGEGSRRN